MSKYYAANQNSAQLEQIASASKEMVEVEVTLTVEVPFDYLIGNPVEGISNLAYLHKEVLAAAILEKIEEQQPEKIADLKKYWECSDALHTMLQGHSVRPRLAKELFATMKQIGSIYEREGYESRLVELFADKGINLE